MSRKLTSEEFIERAKAVHGDKYDYSLVDYKTYKDKVEIICNSCGNHFTQTPGNHINKKGCPNCGVKKAAQSQVWSHERWAEEIYSVNPNIEIKERVKNSITHVSVRCIICNHMWKATPSNLKRHGCPKCGRVKGSQNKTIPSERQLHTIKKINPYIEIFGHITGDRAKIHCRCKICSHDWSSSPSNLKRGHGCPKCAGRLKKTHTEWEETIGAANPSIEVLGKIINGKTKVLCRCKICDHRWFSKPNNLTHGRGCPKCAKKGFLAHDYGKLYIMVDDLEVPTLMKIGVSVSVEKRKDRILKSAKKAGAGIYNLHIVKTLKGSTENVLAVEKSMHKAFRKCKINLPVKFDGSTEFFCYRPEVFSIVEAAYKEICSK